MTPRAIHIVQCLCPQRHCVLALAYAPGLTAAQKDFGGSEDVTLDESNAVAYLRSVVEGLIARKSINGWCGLCLSRDLSYEDAGTRFRSLDEAEPFLRQLEKEQHDARRAFGEGSAIAMIPQRSAPGKN